MDRQTDRWLLDARLFWGRASLTISGSTPPAPPPPLALVESTGPKKKIIKIPSHRPFRINQFLNRQCGGISFFSIFRPVDCHECLAVAIGVKLPPRQSRGTSQMIVFEQVPWACVGSSLISQRTYAQPPQAQPQSHIGCGKKCPSESDRQHSLCETRGVCWVWVGP